MKSTGYVLAIASALILLVASLFTVGTRLHRQTSAAMSAIKRDTGRAPELQTSGKPAAQPSAAMAGTSAFEDTEKHLGPFAISGQNVSVVLKEKRIAPNAGTIIGMEIRDASDAVIFQKKFPFTSGDGDFIDGWEVSARSLTRAGGTGLLATYDGFSEPSAPVEEETEYFQVFGVVNGKIVPFGPPVMVEGEVYETARGDVKPSGRETDVLDVKVWTGHFRLLYPLRIDWARGKLAPAQQCKKTAEGKLGSGCEYRVLPEEKRYMQEDMTFVRLYASPGGGEPQKVVVKTDSKVEYLSAIADVAWQEGDAASAPKEPNNPVAGAGSLGVNPDGELWLKLRIDGKEGWIHTYEDFHALGLPEDQ